MSEILKNVTIVGAAGNLGSTVFQKLVDSKQFNIQVLRRPESTSQYPAGIKVIDVDFRSIDALTVALQDQDVVVSVLGATSLHLQTGLIDASIKAGVRRFIPSEFGSDAGHPKNRALLPFIEKVKVEDYLVEKAKTTSLSYTFIYTGAFLDWGIRYNFVLDTSSYQPVLFDDGNQPFSTTTLDTIANGVVGVLTHPAGTENQTIYLSDFKVSQNELLSIAKKVAPSKPWQPKQVPLDAAVAEADKRLAQGIVDMGTIVPYLYRSLFDPSHGGSFQKTDNERLGVTPKDKTILEELYAEVLK
ncbi:hypothetical protein E4U43_004945 [Claviceps pusilla]|uniref:NmrA-like domain-containing protein n=1 Tax=Claviceps pusilla TaxID=123648 RepID=A0A9P7N574_9HYPO|nr:hypothetical protein E4U43_004945 [Claviceps pusilla]